MFANIFQGISDFETRDIQNYDTSLVFFDLCTVLFSLQSMKSVHHSMLHHIAYLILQLKELTEKGICVTILVLTSVNE